MKKESKIEKFNRELSEIPTEKLVEDCHKHLHEICKNPRKFTMTIPCRLDDTDVMFSEAFRRLKDIHSDKPLSKSDLEEFSFKSRMKRKPEGKSVEYLTKEGIFLEGLTRYVFAFINSSNDHVLICTGNDLDASAALTLFTGNIKSKAEFEKILRQVKVID